MNRYNKRLYGRPKAFAFRLHANRQAAPRRFRRVKREPLYRFWYRGMQEVPDNKVRMSMETLHAARSNPIGEGSKLAPKALKCS